MDVVGEVLGRVRARGAVVRRVVKAAPWAVGNSDAAPLSLYAPVSGSAWIVTESGPAVAVHTGDIAVVRGPHPHVVADHPATPPDVLVHGARHCTHPATGAAVPPSDEAGADGPAVLLLGAYEAPDDVGRRLLRALPEVLVVPARHAPGPVRALALAEVRERRPGRTVVADRLLDLLLVETLRAWFARPDADAPGWYRARGDDVVGPVLRALHDEPARSWTVAELADVAGVSRAALARRFTALVGEPPMRYLTSVRMALAADLLDDPGTTVAAAARAAGYRDPFAFAAAFKRTRGVTPSEHRGAAR